jgi:hypothetical protein
MEKTFYEFIFNENPIIFHKDNIIKVQVGKGSGSYKTTQTFKPENFGQAVFHYNCINIGNGFKKRLYCENLNNKTLAKALG